MGKSVLYLMVGYPGAGKTTAAQIIAKETGAKHIWTDHERREMFGEPTYSAAENSKLYERLNSLAGQTLAGGRSVIFDTNFSFLTDRQHLRKIAEDSGSETRVIWLTTPKEIAKKRAIEDADGQDTRLYGNMHESDFERIAGHLEPPTKDEKVIKLDGTKLDEKELIRLLSQ